VFKEQIMGLMEEFNSKGHGSSDYDKDLVFIMSDKEPVFIPWSWVIKSLPELKSPQQLKSEGFVFSSYDFLELSEFDQWYQKQFQKKLTSKLAKGVGILHFPDQKRIFETVNVVYETFQILKDHKVLINGKNLPIQLGEWYAKIIFGLHQVKSASQRGFDFKTEDGKVVEVKVHWQDLTSPKGVKLKKSLMELSNYTIVMYVAKNFTIRDILFLDSEFVLRKFDSKGHTLFLKDQDVLNYFFSRSNKHFDKVANMNALMRFASPQFAMKLDDKIEEKNNQN
jgi:hypothetical protein